MRLTSKKIIVLLLLLVCAQALIIAGLDELLGTDRKSTRLNSSHPK